MELDTDKVDDTVLALLYLNTWEERLCGARAWKGHDWDALARLHEKGYIGDPISKAKSVAMTPAGIERGRKLFEELFAKTP